MKDTQAAKRGKVARTIQLLRMGWQTAMSSAMKGGCMSLSQRCGELKRDGYKVLDKWVTTEGGSRIKAYRIAEKQ